MTAPSPIPTPRVGPLLDRLLARQDLETAQVEALVEAMLAGTLPPASTAAVLVALRAKGESVAEISAAARVMRRHAVPVEAPPGVAVVDTCGTGGDGTGTFNLSTAAALTAAAAGAVVAKHGNRSVSSLTGSADVLEALGVATDLEPQDLAELLRTLGVAFLFAPNHHAATRHVAVVRRELGVRTVFNLLGPLCNPAGASRQVLGVYDVTLVQPLAEVLRALGSERALVVHGAGGLDELALHGPTACAELRGGEVRTFVVHPAELGLSPAPLSALAGGEPIENAAILRAIFAGERSPRADAVALNAGAALWVADRASDLRAGVELAAQTLASGAVERLLANLVEETRARSPSLRAGTALAPRPHSPPPAAPAATAPEDEVVEAEEEGLLDRVRVEKAMEVARLRRAMPRGRTLPVRPLSWALSGRPRGPLPLGVIAEFKRRSPSRGPLRPGADPADIAAAYVRNGAAAISVLTDGPHFGGSVEDLAAVRRVVEVPVLRKDFLIDPVQVAESRYAGADAVLLIAGLLGGEGLGRMLEEVRRQGMEALVEVHDEAELELALSFKVRILGVNNRDLSSLREDLATTERLLPRVPRDVLKVSESGMHSRADLERMVRAGANAVLVGTALMRAPDPGEALRRLLYGEPG